MAPVTVRHGEFVTHLKTAEAAAQFVGLLQSRSLAAQDAYEHRASAVVDLAVRAHDKLSGVCIGRKCSTLKDCLYHARRMRPTVLTSNLLRKLNLLNDCASLLRHFNPGWQSQLLKDLEELASELETIAVAKAIHEETSSNSDGGPCCSARQWSCC